MCCCNQPTINGEFGYKWQPSDVPSTLKPSPPPLEPRDEVLFDEPGRCGGVDSHCHHFTVVRQHTVAYLLVQHGGGSRRYRLSCYDASLGKVMPILDSNQRYWVLSSIYRTQDAEARQGRDTEAEAWRMAFLEKRLTRRKYKGRVRVDILPQFSHVTN